MKPGLDNFLQRRKTVLVSQRGSLFILAIVVGSLQTLPLASAHALAISASSPADRFESTVSPSQNTVTWNPGQLNQKQDQKEEAPLPSILLAAANHRKTTLKKTPAKKNTAHKTAMTKPAVKAPASKSKAKVTTTKPKTVSAHQPPAKKPAQKPHPKAVTQNNATAREAEPEVINNILGTPVVPEKRTNFESTDKPFSFIDANGSPSQAFDYGVFIHNSHLLDDYRRRVEEGLESAQQLALSVRSDEIEKLLKSAIKHKREFETLYPSPNPAGMAQGLQEWEKARKDLLQAMAMVTLAPHVEGRTIWLDRGSIVEAGGDDGLRKLLKRLHHAGINVIYLESINAGFPIYPSKVLPMRNPLVKGWDPLATAVSEGHKLGMEIHAWVWAFAVGNRRHNTLLQLPESYPGPILSDANLMPEALKNKKGGLSVDGRQFEYWLSPASPKARTFLLDAYKELVSNYAVDGIHLDYIRYPFQTASTRMGYETVGREQFRQATGHQPEEPGTDIARLWTAWKTYQVNTFVQDVSTTLRPLRPGLQISAAVFPMRRAARLAAIQQDWETWVDKGWVDTLSPMSYTTDPERLQALYEAVIRSPKNFPMVYPGIALSKLDDGQLLLQLEALRDRGSLGSTLFAGAHLTEDKANALANGAYRQDAIPPHRDLPKALLTLLGDYESTLNRLSSSSAPDPVDTDKLKPIRQALKDVQAEVTALPSVASGTITPEAITRIEQKLATLNTTTEDWLTDDRLKHPLRARFFEDSLSKLNELLGYLRNKITRAKAAGMRHREAFHFDIDEGKAAASKSPSVSQ